MFSIRVYSWNDMGISTLGAEKYNWQLENVWNKDRELLLSIKKIVLRIYTSKIST